jgi:hypothetical protein
MRSDLVEDTEVRRGRRARRGAGWLGVLLVVLCTAPLHGEILDRVLAVVAGRLIMLSDVTAARDLQLVPVDPGADPIRAVLTRLIDRELVLVEVDRYAPPEPSAAAVDAEVQRVRARFSSAAALDAALARSGLDGLHLRETLRQDLRMRAYLDQRFAGAGDRRQALVDEWMAGLRRRGDVMDLYLPGQQER